MRATTQQIDLWSNAETHYVVCVPIVLLQEVRSDVRLFQQPGGYGSIIMTNSQNLAILWHTQVKNFMWHFERCGRFQVLHCPHSDMLVDTWQLDKQTAFSMIKICYSEGTQEIECIKDSDKENAF